MESGLPPDALDRTHGLARRDFLKVGAGFSLALTLAGALGTLGGCGEAAKSPAKSFAFLQDSDLELFTRARAGRRLDLAELDAGERNARVGEVLRNLDATCSAMGLASRQELRKLLDLLAIAPLRYVLTGVGAWNEASIETLQAFLARWREQPVRDAERRRQRSGQARSPPATTCCRRAGRHRATRGRWPHVYKAVNS